MAEKVEQQKKRQIVTVHNPELEQESRALNTALPYMKGWKEGPLPKKGEQPQDSGDQNAEVSDAPAPADTSDAARRRAK